ncbi:blastula protease 10-like [Tubulanus polymorphus]|uniref:blastula protease 10-like n=1 Tax=Tubulanus polymorphus TaxID=672921 RepID=UPI003DA3F7E5
MAMDFYERNTCIRFYTKDQNITRNQKGYVIFSHGSGCYASQGYVDTNGNGQVNSPCYTAKVMLHELGHTIGLYHEQLRTDRDMYVKIYFGNTVWIGDPDCGDQIEARLEIPQILKKKQTVGSAHANVYDRNVLTNTEYDETSIMHYNAWDFSSNGKRVYDFLDKSHRFLMTSAKYPTFHDVKAINLAYNCSELMCSNFHKTCQNLGYVTMHNKESCKCVCPEGLGGDLCETIAKPSPPPTKWPPGGFALPVPIQGCPSDEFEESAWKTTYARSTFFTRFEKKHHWKYKNYYTWSWNFCALDAPPNQPNQAEWGPGRYCFDMVKSCPAGFSQTVFEMDGLGGSLELGPLPEGQILIDGQIKRYFCCRAEESFPNQNPLKLPTQKHFVLYPIQGSECQAVEGMHVLREWKALMKKDAVTFKFTGTHIPRYSQWWTDIQFNYCYYYPISYDCGGVFELDNNIRTLAITSPNFPSNYKDGQQCTWFIKAPKNARIQFTLHELELEGIADSCHDYLEVKAHTLGQIGKRYCGKTADAFKTITSTKNHLMLVFTSDYGVTKKGFSGTASIITEDQFCYNVEDRGESYRGNISYTQSFVECLPWEEMTHCEFHPFTRRGFNAGLEGHNHCRNPGGTTVSPWCYTQKEMCKQDMCDVCQFNIRCKPAVLSKGVIQKDPVQAEYRVGDVVLFGCDNGGTEHFTRMCQSDGTWSGDDIRCIGCLPGSVEVNGYCVYVSDEAASFNGAIIECNKFGYELASVHDEILQNDLLGQMYVLYMNE